MEFKFPNVVFGQGSLSQLGERLQGFGAKKAMCVYDDTIKNLGLADKVLENIKAAGIECITFGDVKPNPRSTDIDAAAELARSEGVDVVVGVGGGSVMDTAKCVNILLTNEGKILDYAGKPCQFKPVGPVVLIPTTSGTGSEGSRAAVMLIPETGEKIGVMGPVCVAALSIVDPTLASTMPPKVTANTGMDAFAHAFESYTCKASNRMSEILACEAMRLVAGNIKAAVTDGSNMEARENMSFAATAAGMAMGCSGGHLGHYIGGALEELCNVPHGCACSIGTPPAVELIKRAVPEKIKVVCGLVGIETAGKDADTLGSELASTLRSLNRSIGLPSLKDVLGQESDIDKIVENCVANAWMLMDSPVQVTGEELYQVLKAEYSA